MASMLPVDLIVNDIQHETPRPRSPRLRTHASASLLRFPACHESAARILSTPLLSHPTHAPTPERAGARHRRSISGAARRTRQAGDFAGRLARAPCPGLRRRVHRNGRGVSRRGGLLRLMLADTRHRRASHPHSPPARGRRSLGSPAVHHRTSSAPRHRHARRRPCRISRDRKPIALVRVYRRRVRSRLLERAMSPASAVTIGRGDHGFRLKSRHVRMLHPASFLDRDSCVPEPERPGNQSAGPLQRRAQPRSGRGACGG